MTRRETGVTAAVVLAALAVAAGPAALARQGGGYDALVALHRDFRAARQVPAVDGLPDYRRETMARREAGLAAFQARLASIDPAGWPRPQRVDWLLVQSEMNDLAFEHAVRRPWSRDPGVYADLVTRIPFTRLPLAADRVDGFRARLRSVPQVVAQARTNLTEGARELVALALCNLEHHDGVGHGHPYREVPPEGTIGWYQDLIAQTDAHHPTLTPDARAALRAVEGFRDWLRASQPRMTAPAGVGRDNLNWYMTYVKRMPFSDRDALTIGDRELHRSGAFLALQRHRNRALPPLDPAASAEEYAARIREADAHIREFIRANDILTVPDYIGELSTNVPWMVRPGGRNFWEEIQYRDPRPDHLHAVIPGHRFDAQVSRRDTRPFRGTYADEMTGLDDEVAGMFAAPPPPPAALRTSTR